MNKPNNPSAFTKLKPLCINFLRDCNLENIYKLENIVKELDSESVQLMQEFITVPLRAHLNINLREKITIKCIEFLTLVFKKSSVVQWDSFTQYFSLMLSKIGDPLDKASNVSEELKLTICENILSLIRCGSEDVLNEMYSLSFRPYLAHAFFVFNILLRQEKSKTLLKAVLSTIGALTYNEKYVLRKFTLTEQIASEALASCLPGLSIALQKFICSDDKLGHSIITMALGILTELIVLTTGDESYERGIAKDSSCNVHYFAYKCGKQRESALVKNDAIPVVMKDEEWFKTVSEKLKVIIKNLSLLSSHDHWNVRLEFLKCSKLLLFKCTKTLENCVPVLLPLVFGLCVDNNEIISTFSKNLLVSLSELSQNMNCTVNSTIDSNTERDREKLITQLIKHKFSASDDKKLATLKSLLGYIEISGLSQNKLLFSMTHLERIVLMLLTLLEFDISELNLVQEVQVECVENFDIDNPSWPKKKFKFFKNPEILNVICRICYSLGLLGNPRLLIDYLLEKLSVSNLYTLQCIFVIGRIIKGLSRELDASEKYSSLVSDVLDVFFSNSLLDERDTYMNLDGHVNETSMEQIKPNNVFNKNKLQICLLLEAVAICSECLGSDFKIHLIKVLCPIMEKAGNSNFVISQCGQLCLYYFAQSCKYKSIQELIKDNADYITNIILINFHQYLCKPEIVVVLRVAMEQCDAEAVMLFRDLIFQVLNFLDYNQDKAYPLMVVLFSVVVYIKKWFPCKEDFHFSPTNISYKNLKTSVLEYINLKKSVMDPALEDFEKEDMEDICDAKDEYAIERDKPIPLHVTIICEIFKRCIHLQSSENQYLRMLTLETVELCILVLHDYENQLLPLIHEFWSPFLRRFSEGTFVSKAFNVILTIANECGDFIRSRTLKDVIPKIELFLQKERSKSNLKCNYRHYQWTSDHALQVLVLSEIGNLCTKLDIDDKDVNVIANVCLPYLEKEQPKVLQDAAMKSLKALATYHSDAIWFYWNVLYSEKKTLIPPHNSLLELSFPISNNSLTSCEWK